MFLQRNDDQGGKQTEQDQTAAEGARRLLMRRRLPASSSSAISSWRTLTTERQAGHGGSGCGGGLLRFLSRVVDGHQLWEKLPELLAVGGVPPQRRGRVRPLLLQGGFDGPRGDLASVHEGLQAHQDRGHRPHRVPALGVDCSANAYEQYDGNKR